jgi:predicted secreted protein
MTEIVITKEDHGKTIQVHQGDVIIFRLEENLTTGYEWEAEPSEGSMLELLDSTYVQSPGIALGRGGMRVMRFAAKSLGNQEIHLKLRRSWESPDKTRNRLDVKIQVR